MKILIVDDKKENRLLLRAMLKGNGFTIIPAANGVEALEKLRARKFDMIISDILMPEMDGYQLCKECKKDGSLTNIPFIFYTATYTEPKDEEFALKLGADRFILKPIEPKKFIRIIREVIREMKTKKKTPIKPALKEDAGIFKLYNQRLVNKLEKKMLDLETSEQKYLNLFENVNDLVFSLDEKGCFSMINSKTKLFGYKPEDALGKHFSHFLTPESRKIAEDHFRQAWEAKSDTRERYEVEIMSRDGSVSTGELSISSIFKDRRFMGRFGIIRDITNKKLAQKKLRESEETFRLMTETTPNAVTTTDLEGKITFVSPRALDLFGYQNKKELLGKNAFEFMVSEEREKAQKNLQKILSSGIQKDVGYALIKKDGTRFFGEVSAALMKDISGKPIGFIVVTKDITSHRESVNVLRESEQRYRALFEGAAEGILVADIETKKFMYANPSLCRMLGYTEKELININVNDLHPQESLKHVLSEFEAQARGEKTLSSAIPCLRKNGTVIYTDINTSKIIIDGRECNAGFFTDITEYKKMQEELEQYRNDLEELVIERTEKLNKALVDSENNRDRIDTILKSVSDGLIVSDINHHIILMNSLAEDWLGIRFSETYNQTIDIALKEPKLQKLIKETLSGRSKTSRLDIETKIGKNGQKQILAVSAKIIMDRSKKSLGILTTIRDVTREREIDRMKTDFLSTTAHELRTPLTTIRGFSEILLTRDNLKNGEKKKFLGYINNQAVYLGYIISDLLDISRIESGIGFKLQRKKCIINKIISKMIDTYQISYPKNTFVSSLEETNASVFADTDKLRQVMQNILNNAVHYSPGGGTIKITTETNMDEYKVVVEDQGIGMTKGQVSKIFEKFYRADYSEMAPKGTGLGMSIVELIIKNHKGKIWIESKPKKGTRVIFTIPIGLREDDNDNIDGQGEIKRIG